MKKRIFGLFFVLLSIFLVMPAKAQEQNEPQLITFIYLNGSNDYDAQNRTKFKEAFENDVNKMHPVMVEYLSKDETLKSQFLKDGQYAINPEPVIFYWGDRSLNEVEHIDSGLNIAKLFTPKVAQTVRSLFAHCLHDAIWIQKYQNMHPVVNELQTVVNEETAKGRKVVLLGYSAGSFITYQYFLNKFNSIDTKRLMLESNDENLAELAMLYPAKPTCLDAMLDAQLLTIDSYGQFQMNPNKDKFIENYKNMDSYTQNACFFNDSVKGVINFASPFLLFYSEVTDDTTILNHLSQLMLKNIVENDVFFLTVNFRNDPLGYPIGQNMTLEDMKALKLVTGADVKPNGGFTFVKSDVYVPKTFVSAHMAYWSSPKRFVKGVIEAYKDGYSHFYGSKL